MKLWSNDQDSPNIMAIVVEPVLVKEERSDKINGVDHGETYDELDDRVFVDLDKSTQEHAYHSTYETSHTEEYIELDKV